MRLQVDGIVLTHTPDDIAWESPPQVGTDGVGAPVFGPYHSCRLIFGTVTFQGASREWREFQDGTLHDVYLPHPDTEVMTLFTCYVGQMSYSALTYGCPVAAGGEITLTRITVT